jgi:fructosamine-3-kinase
MPWARITDTPGDVHLERLIALGLRRRVVHSRLLGEGALGITHAVDLDGPPQRVVVKWQKRLGQAAREARQLEELRRHAIVKVPEVLCCHVGCRSKR